MPTVGPNGPPLIRAHVHTQACGQLAQPLGKRCEGLGGGLGCGFGCGFGAARFGLIGYAAPARAASSALVAPPSAWSLASLVICSPEPPIT